MVVKVIGQWSFTRSNIIQLYSVIYSTEKQSFTKNVFKGCRILLKLEIEIIFKQYWSIFN